MKSRCLFLIFLFLAASCGGPHPLTQRAIGVCEIVRNIDSYSGENVVVSADVAEGINFDMVLWGDDCGRIIILDVNRDDVGVQKLMRLLFSRVPGELPGTPSDRRIPVVVEGVLMQQPEGKRIILSVDRLVFR